MVLDPAQVLGDERGPGGVTTLMRAATLKNPEELPGLIAKTGKDRIDDKDNEGWTALHYAAVSGFCENIAGLLDAGAFPLCKNNDGDTPFELAKRNGRIDAMVLLEKAEKSAPLIKPEELPARVVALEETVEELRRVIEKLRNDAQQKPEKAVPPPTRSPAGGP